ncbi:MAG: response regulator [Chitinophagales bacterium]
MKLNVFIVDDEVMYSKMLSYIFNSKEEYNLHVFANGQDCIANLALNPDVILLDYSLPDVSGEIVLQQIKQFNKDIFVIVISGSVDKNTPKNMLKMGAFDFISKDLNTKYRILNIVNLQKEVLVLRQEKEILLKKLKE